MLESDDKGLSPEILYQRNSIFETGTKSSSEECLVIDEEYASNTQDKTPSCRSSAIADVDQSGHIFQQSASQPVAHFQKRLSVARQLFPNSESHISILPSNQTAATYSASAECYSAVSLPNHRVSINKYIQRGGCSPSDEETAQPIRPRTQEGETSNSFQEDPNNTLPKPDLHLSICGEIITPAAQFLEQIDEYENMQLRYPDTQQLLGSECMKVGIQKAQTKNFNRAETPLYRQSSSQM